jgi:asparagine synthetase B (glutamine-hydrolysing)
VPFLDRNFLDIAMAIDPSEKMIDKSQGEHKIHHRLLQESFRKAKVVAR